MDSKSKKSHIFVLHIVKLVLRLILFGVALTIYIANRAWEGEGIFGNETTDLIMLATIFALFLIDMIFRFFPSNVESKGCQKQFAKNFIPTSEKIPQKQSPKPILIMFFIWTCLGALAGGLYFGGIINKGILVIISLMYSVCDMICIMFFCPFQTFIMKNKCCTTCRIYNWDFIMIFTPLIFIVSVFSWGLIFVSLILLIQWEIIYHKHPERFAQNTNACLSCENCSEKSCHNKNKVKKLFGVTPKK